MEDKIIALIAHAEQLQDETIEIFRETEKSTNHFKEELSKTIKELKKKFYKMILAGVMGVVTIAIIATVILFFGFKGFVLLRVNQIKTLNKEMIVLREKAEEWRVKAGKANLNLCGENKRLCVEVDKESGTFMNGKKEYKIIEGY